MAVYTPLTESDIKQFLARYDIGALAEFHGIAEGIDNSNFLLLTAPPAPGQGPVLTELGEDGLGKYILTVFESRIAPQELPYFLTLMEWLNARGVTCPQPVKNRDGRMLGALKEKPAAIVTFLEGGGAMPIRPEHLPLLGDLAARMHLAGVDFPHVRENTMGPAAWEAIIDKIIDRVDEIAPGLRTLINEEFNYVSGHWPDGLPRGAVHGDLFPDNVFFTRQRGGAPVLSGVIDFYFACTEMWAYDLAIIVNAWCFDSRDRFQPERVAALMQAYTELRNFTPEEEAAFPLLLRAAALRFLLTRAHDKLFQPAGAVVTPKDPLEYVRKLEFFRAYKG